jgi:zinc ribbon protein
MPNCTNCGADLPTNARFCSNCGKVPATAATASAQPPQMRVSPMQSIPPSLPQPTSASQSGEQYRHTPPSTDGTDSSSSMVGVPFTGTQGQQTPSPTDGTDSSRNEQPPQPQFPMNNMPAFKPANPHRLGNIPLRWLIIGLVVIVVLASGLGILASVVRSRLPSSTTSSSQNTPGLCANRPLCTPPPGLKTPVIGGGTAVINLTLSGAVNGRLRATNVSRCGISGTQYDLLVQGKVGGTEYDLVFRVTNYHGASTYTAGQLFTNLTQQPVSATTTWVNAGNAQATATIHSNVKSGSMNVTVSGAVNTVHITGSWKCA